MKPHEILRSILFTAYKTSVEEREGMPPLPSNGVNWRHTTGVYCTSTGMRLARQSVALPAQLLCSAVGRTSDHNAVLRCFDPVRSGVPAAYHHYIPLAHRAPATKWRAPNNSASPA